MSKRHHLLAAGITGALLLWFFAPALSGASGFAFRDAAHYYYPLFQWIRDQWGAGRVPLWNPYENLGVALVAENTSSVFYPGKLLFALPLDYTLLYNLYIVVHVVLAAVAAYCLARHTQRSIAAATLAAISYAFSGSVLFQYCNVVFLVGAAWLPLAILAADRLFGERRWRFAVELGAVLTMMITGGDPQMAYNAVLLAAIYMLLSWRDDRRRPTTVLQAPARPWRQGRLVLLAGAVATAGLSSAVQILPTLEASRASGRAAYDAPRNIYELAASLASSHDRDRRLAWYSGLVGGVSRGHERQIYHFSVPPWRAAELVWPNFAGRPFPTDRRWLAALDAENNLWTPSLYMGLLPLVLALATWSLRRTAPLEVRFASWMVLLGGLASLGIYGVAWFVGLVFGGSELLDVGGEIGGLYWWMTVLLPSYAYFRYPAKLFVVAALGLSLLAARGWDLAWPSESLRLRRWFVALLLLSLAGLGALALGWSYVERRAEEHLAGPLVGPFDASGAWWDVVGALAQTAIVSAILLAMLFFRDHRRGRFVGTAALLLTAVDLAVAQRGLVLYAPADDWRSTPEVLDALPRPFVQYRVFRQIGPLAPSWQRRSSPERYTECLHWDRATLWPKYPLPYGVSLAEAMETMVSSDYETLLDVAREHSARRGKGHLPDASVLDLLSARVAIVAEHVAAADALRLSTPGEGMLAVLRPSALPRAWIVHDVEIIPELPGRAPWRLKQRTREVLFPGGQARDWSKVAVVESDRPVEPRPEPLAEGASERCTLVRAEPLEIELDVELANAGLVVLSDLYYPGWELTVETSGQSRSVPIVRTNRVMRGALLPAGKHRLVYRYRPWSVYLGGAISVASLLALAVTAIVIRRRL